MNNGKRVARFFVVVMFIVIVLFISAMAGCVISDIAMSAMKDKQRSSRVEPLIIDHPEYVQRTILVEDSDGKMIYECTGVLSEYTNDGKTTYRLKEE